MSNPGAGASVLDSEKHLKESVLPSKGYSAGISWLPTMPEYYGAKKDNVTDDTLAFQLCSQALTAMGKSGDMELDYGTYIVDGFALESGIKIKGKGGTSFGTKLRAKAGSANPAMIIAANGPIIGASIEGVAFLPNGNKGQDCMRFTAKELGAEKKGGLWGCLFKDLQIGVVNAAAWSGCCMWFQGGAATNLLPHQYNRFENVGLVSENEGAVTVVGSGKLVGPTTSRCLKLTGQCEKFTFDGTCVFDGKKNLTPGIGCLIEVSREFLFSTILEADCASGENKITVASVEGLEPNKIFTIGEGAYNEVCQVQSILGKEVTLTKPLEYSHKSADTNLYLLSGTVAAPATFGAAEIALESGTYQNADIVAVLDTASIIDFFGCDFENIVHGYKVRGKSLQVNAHGIHPNSASKGTQNGTGTVTVGSAFVTNTTSAWAVGDVLNCKGSGKGKTVLKVEGTTVELNAPIEPNGTEGPIAGVPLTKGGENDGYIARYEPSTQGEVSYYASGPIDNSVISVEATVRVAKLARNSSIPIGQSSGVTLSKAATAVLDVQGVRELVLTNAGATIREFQGVHGPGEMFTTRATVNGTTFLQDKVNGTNLSIPNSGKLVLGAGEVATWLRTDNGMTYVLVGVQRAQEELEYKEVEALNANLEIAAGYPEHIQAAVRLGRVMLKGTMNVKAEIAISSVLFTLPAGMRPETRRILLLTNTEKYISIIVETNGNVVIQSAVKVNTKISFDGITFDLKP